MIVYYIWVCECMAVWNCVILYKNDRAVVNDMPSNRDQNKLTSFSEKEMNCSLVSSIYKCQILQCIFVYRTVCSICFRNFYIFFHFLLFYSFVRFLLLYFLINTYSVHEKWFALQLLSHCYIWLLVKLVSRRHEIFIWLDLQTILDFKSPNELPSKSK